jgi:hypothetical protein
MSMTWQGRLACDLRFFLVASSRNWRSAD